MQKLEKLRQLLGSYESCIVAYSGGVDSALLAWVAHQALGSRALAVIADSPSLPRRELDDALQLANTFNFAARVLPTHEFDNPAYAENPPNRCYFCKHELFNRLSALASAEGFRVIAYGENASDAGEHRPGAAAAQEFSIHAPLKELGITKSEVRALSAQVGLPTADKPQMPCLSSRIPHGERVTLEKLGMIERAELFLREQGFRELRVRHFETSSGARALIEVAPEELTQLQDPIFFLEVRRRLREIGYAETVADPKGYRRGSLNSVPSRVESTVT